MKYKVILSRGLRGNTPITSYHKIEGKEKGIFWAREDNGIEKNIKNQPLRTGFLWILIIILFVKVRFVRVVIEQTRFNGVPILRAVGLYRIFNKFQVF